MPFTQPSKPCRVAILGSGGIAFPHAAALKSIADVELVAVCDLDGAKARSFQQHWRIPQVFDDLGTMLDQSSLDAVHVLLPAGAHAKAAEACLAAGRHVFVEKPFCTSVEDCLRVQRTADRCGRQIGVNHNLTFTPGFLDAADLIRECRLGAVQHVTVQYNLPTPGLARGPHNHWMFGGPERLMLEIGPHPVSVIYRLLGKVTQCIAQASGEMTLANGTLFYHTWQSSLVCERGTAQFLLSVGKSYPNTWIHILGQDGEAFIDLARYIVRVSERNRYLRVGNLLDGTRSAASLLRQTFSNFHRYSLGAMGLRPPYTWQEVSIRNSIAAFYRALTAGDAVPVGAVEGTDVVKACEWVASNALQQVKVDQRISRG